LVAITDTEAGLEAYLPTTDILIATPFWPAYSTRGRIQMAPNLRLLLTAGVGPDHFDLAAAAERNITVAEITGSNVVSVAEHVVMQILTLVRNYIPSYFEVTEGGWGIGKVAARPHDLEDKSVGIAGMGRIGQQVATRLKPLMFKLITSITAASPPPKSRCWEHDTRDSTHWSASAMSSV
jgi:formate dehydrogenase